MTDKKGLPPLELVGDEGVLEFIDQLDRQGGIEAVIDWVARELQPGRQISTSERGTCLRRIVDRSVWRLDTQSGRLDEALLSPLTSEDFGESELFAVWSRPLASVPFAIRLRVDRSSNS